MNGYLLDTNVISMLSPSSGSASPAFLDWLDQADALDQLFLSVVTIHEIEKGIALLEQKGATAKAAGLKLWLKGLVATYNGKVLEIDLGAAGLAGRLEAKAIAQGHMPGMADASLAGVALAHDLIVVTHNTRHFMPFGVAVRTPDALILQA